MSNAAKCVLLTMMLINCFFIFSLVSKNTHKYDDIKYSWIIDKMPLVDNDPFATAAYGGYPIEQRGIEYRKWLSAGLKIIVPDGSGSGTIVYFDPESGWAYVQSCGHLWSGNMTAEQGLSRNVKCQVKTWYHNLNKLIEPRIYPAEVIYYSNISGKDCSLLRFKPDWKPDYFPIGSNDFSYHKGMEFHSIGCDGGREVAHYDVEYVGMMNGSIVTTRNSPRPGRSGGGLISKNNYYVGICWGTSNYNGNANGYFTTLSALRKCNEENGYGWLNNVNLNLARMIPIIDKNSPQRVYPWDYIPMPRSK